MYFLIRIYNALLLISLITAQDCGQSGRVVSLVINGTESSKGSWPWLVSLFDFTTNQLFCGGTIIDADTVITAAHCIQDKGQRIPRSTLDIIIKLGRYDLSQPYERGSIDAQPLDIFIHPNWKVNTKDYDSDIAIIKLSSPVAFNNVIYPICMWKRNEPPVVNSGYIVGYGKSENDAPHEFIPRELDVNIITNEDCFLKSPRFTYISSANTFCAGKNQYSSACRGDSGGGMYIEVSGRWYLRGIVSASFFRRDFSCDTSADTLFTNVLKYLDWISQKSSVIIPNKLNRQSVNHNKEIVCYVASWSVYRQGLGKFTSDNIKPELCTTLIYHFAGLDDYGKLKSLDEWADMGENGGLDGYNRITSLKNKYSHLKVLLAIGGWNEGAKKYSNLVADSSKRREFAVQSSEFLKQHNFDGLNFFWDYPGDQSRGGKTADKENFPLLLKEIYDLYQEKKLYLSVTLRSSKWVTSFAYNIEEIAKNADAINIMTFDYAGAYDGKIKFPAPLKTELQHDNIEAAVSLFIRSKVPKNKIILGIPFYARTFKTTGDGNIDDESELTGFSGPIIESDHLVGFNELCLMKDKKSWIFRFYKEPSQMIGKFIENGKMNVAIYDTPRSVANKVKYVMENGFLGVFAWSIDTDDIHGNCSFDDTTYNDFNGNKPEITDYKDFPLLRTMNDVVNFMTVGN